MSWALVVPLAHPGHWVESLAFAGPVLLLPLALGAMVLRERRRARREGPDASPNA